MKACFFFQRLRPLPCWSATVWAAACVCFFFWAPIAQGTASDSLISDGQDEIERIQLDNVQWQLLPPEIAAVTIGPDTRIWYTFSRERERHRKSVRHGVKAPEEPFALDHIRKRIKKEFRSETPHLSEARPVFFEPGGRVWFVTTRWTNLIGYDGTGWIDCPESAPYRFMDIGNCPGNGRRRLQGYNCFCAGRVFFINGRGVVVVDVRDENVAGGGDWFFHEMLEDKKRRENFIELQAFPEEGRVVASVSTQPRVFWEWRDGAWTTIDFEIPGKELVAPWSHNRAWCRDGEGIRLLPLADLSDELVGNLLEEIKSAPGTRGAQEAVKRLIELGCAIEPNVVDALGKTYDPEAIAHLLHVQENIRVDRGLILGDLELEKADLLFNDFDGTVYLGAEQIHSSKEAIGPGLVIVRTDGTMSLKPAQGVVDILTRGRPIPSHDSGPLRASELGALWLPGRYDCIPPRLVDLDSGEVTHTLDDHTFDWLHTVTPEGRLFVSHGRYPDRSTVAVFTPGAPRAHLRLKAHTIPLRNPDLVVAPDGAVWAQAVNGDLVRFDGEESFVQVGPGALRLLAAGRESCLLTRRGEEYMIISSHGVERNKNALDLIKNNRAIIRRALPAGHDCWSSASSQRLAVDSARNIWWSEGQNTWVLANDEWIDIRAPVDHRFISLNARYIATVGGGRSVYLTDLERDGLVFFGLVHDGKAVLRPVPAPSESVPDTIKLIPGVRDREGALWVMGYGPWRRGGSGRLQVAFRLDDFCRRTEVVDAGWPLLCDMEGNIWLGLIRGEAPDRFNIWRDGEIIQTVTIPHGDEKTRLFSNRAGSVFAWTPIGLVHLASRDEGEGSRFEAGPVYTVTGLTGRLKAITFSNLGFLVATSTRTVFDDAGERQDLHCLHLVRLPQINEH